MEGANASAARGVEARDGEAQDGKPAPAPASSEHDLLGISTPPLAARHEVRVLNSEDIDINLNTDTDPHIPTTISIDPHADSDSDSNSNADADSAIGGFSDSSSTFSARSSVWDFVNDADGRRYHRYRQGSEFCFSFFVFWRL